MTEPVVYEVTPEPGDDEGFRIMRGDHFCTWHGSESEAVLDAVQLAVDEAVAGTPTIMRVRALDGRLKLEYRYAAGGPNGAGGNPLEAARHQA